MLVWIYFWENMNLCCDCLCLLRNEVQESRVQMAFKQPADCWDISLVDLGAKSPEDFLGHCEFQLLTSVIRYLVTWCRIIWICWHIEPGEVNWQLSCPFQYFKAVYCLVFHWGPLIEPHSIIICVFTYKPAVMRQICSMNLQTLSLHWSKQAFPSSGGGKIMRY